MSAAVRTIHEAPHSHEDEFVRCLQLTGQKDVAEDLLHDGFVQFTINRPDLGPIEDLDGYLCRLMRNHYYARLRLAIALIGRVGSNGRGSMGRGRNTGHCYTDYKIYKELSTI